jgi:hypothetical protein
MQNLNGSPYNQSLTIGGPLYPYYRNRMVLYGGNIGVSQTSGTYGNYLGKWSFIGAHSLTYPPSPVGPGFQVLSRPGIHFLADYHRWGNYDAFFGLRERASDIGYYNEQQTAPPNPDGEIKDALISWGHEYNTPLNRLIFQSIEGVDASFGQMGQYQKQREHATFLSNGNFGIGTDNPTAHLQIKPDALNPDADPLKIEGNSNTLFTLDKNGRFGFNTSINPNNDVQFKLNGNGLSNVFSIDNSSSENLLSIYNNGNLRLAKLASKNNIPSNEYWHLKIDYLGNVSADLDVQNGWNIYGNNYSKQNYNPVFGTNSSNSIDLIAGGEIYGNIRGTNPSSYLFQRKGEISLASSVSIGSDVFNKNLPPTNPYFALNLQNTVELNSIANTGLPSNLFNECGYIHCFDANGTDIMKLGNTELTLLNNSVFFNSDRHTSFIDMNLSLGEQRSIEIDGGSIIPLNNFNGENLGGQSNLWEEIWGGRTYTQNLVVSDRVESHLIPRIQPSGPLYNLGTSIEPWNIIFSSTGTVQKSDIKLKKNVKSISYGIKDILKLNPVSYEWKTNANGTRLGFIAQEVEKIIPNVILKDSLDNYSMFYSELIPVLVKGIQEQQKIIDTLKTQIHSICKTHIKIEDNNFNNHQIEHLNPNSYIVQNHPNPFSGTTYIDYFLTSNAKNAVLRITDVNGKLIKAFEIKSTGYGQIELNCSELNSGSYFYSLIINGNICDTKTMLISNN